MEKSTHTPAYKILCRHLVEMRKAAGLTQRQLAVRLRRDQNLVARLEQGERRLDMIEFVSLVRACGLSPKETAWDLYREIEGLAPLRGRPKPSRRKS